MVGHGHADVDQKFAVLSKCIKKISSVVISRLRLEKAIASSFLSEASKPTTLDVLGVHDWGGYFGPAMANVELGRLACSEDSGNSQHSFTMVPAGDSSVSLTYKRFSSQQERYPRQFNVGTDITTEYGPGQVSAVEYLPDQRSWQSTVSLHNGLTTKAIHPVSGIDMFPSHFLTESPPVYESMAADWPMKVKNIERNILNCTEKLAAVFSRDETVGPEWDTWFKDEKEKISHCQQYGLTYYQGEQQPELLVSEHHQLTPAAAPLCAEDPAVFAFDPVTHVNFTAQQRLKAMSKSQSPPLLTPGGYVLLRLRYNTSGVPADHTLPCFIGVLPAEFSFGSLPDGGFVTFASMFTRSSDITGTWATTGTIQAPLSSILISGLALTQARKITAASQADIHRVVVPYEYNNTTTTP